MRRLIRGKHIGKGATTVDMRTGEEKPAKVKTMMLPAKEGTCEWCATEHDKRSPHNAQSMFYQYRFYNEHGRWPTWKDAMAHCPSEMRTAWVHHLTKAGVNVEAGEVNPRSK